MKINDIETPRLLLRGFTKEDALWAYSIWNDPEMGQYLPDEAKEEIDEEYLKMLEGLGDDDECCYLIPVFKDSLERVGTCSFMISEDKKVYEPIGSLRSNPVKSEEYETLVREAFQVALAKGVHVTEKDVISIIHKFYYDYADNATSSLMRDVAAGKISELETFSGYLVREAQKEGLSVPVSEKMYYKLLTKTQNNVV